MSQPLLAQCILQLFARFFQHGSDVQLAAQTRCCGWRDRLQLQLKNANSAQALEMLDKTWQGIQALPDAQARDKALWEVLLELDAQFAAIHPRYAMTKAGRSRSSLAPWLKEMKQQRENHGFYAESQAHRLIARGPLLKNSRLQEHACAVDSAACFAHLSLAERVYTFQKRKIATQQCCYGMNDSGVFDISPQPVLCLMPLARQAGDLVQTPGAIGEMPSMDYRLAPHLHAAELIWQGLQEGLRSHAKLDLAMAPELLVSAAHAQDLQNKLSAAPAPLRLLVAGSGHSETPNAQGLHWNETRVLNHRGKVLWRQRKIWLAASDGHYEHNAGGDAITIADLDGFGRCLVLICQDCKLEFLTSLIADWQPDWLFIPILDREANTGRWAHQQAFNLSEVSAARIVVLSSLALGTEAPPSAKDCALLQCPKNPTPPDQARARTTVKLPNDAAQAATFIWNSASWMQTKLN
ncbi:hypothetical protein V8J88_02490 [Massilia sp. W12]|uniref:hypothetical protein n=1 Tax=Massilia sp. W12 TaxID=3126507 RepID=UPI0030D000A7